MKNQRGITLIELLLTISIISFVGVLIWSVFFQGTEYSNTAITNNQMQQEANIIMTKITKIIKPPIPMKLIHLMHVVSPSKRC